MKRRLLTLLCWAVSAGATWIVPGVAAAQSGEEASVVVLKFEGSDVSDETMRAVYGAIGQTIERHPEMYVKPGGEVTIQDLALTAGCDGATIDCLSGLRELVGADRVVFGTVRKRADGYALSMKMFDFSDGQFVREQDERSLRAEVLKEALPAAAEAFLYGDTGVAQVNVTGGRKAEILLDGRTVGQAPARVGDLPLGEHVIAVRSETGEEKSETIILRHDRPAQLAFTFDGAGEVHEPRATSDAPSTTPAWIAIGVGALGAGVGVYGLISEADADSTIDELCTPKSECRGLAARLDDVATQQAYLDAKDQGTTALNLQLVGFSVAGAGFVTGALLLYRAYSYEAPVESSTVDFDLAPRDGGVSGSMRIRF